MKQLSRHHRAVAWNGVQVQEQFFGPMQQSGSENLKVDAVRGGASEKALHGAVALLEHVLRPFARPRRLHPRLDLSSFTSDIVSRELRCDAKAVQPIFGTTQQVQNES